MCKKHFSLSRILINVSFLLSLIEINLWENRQFFDKDNGLTPLQNVDFVDFFRTSLFRSKKHSFLSRILKNLSFSLSLTKINIWENRRFFDKNHELTPLQKVHFWTFFKTSLFRSKKHFFLSRISKNLFSGVLWLRTWLFMSKKHSFLSRIWKNEFFRLSLLNMRKTSIFWQKPWTNPFEKGQFLDFFKNFTFQV